MARFRIDVSEDNVYTTIVEAENEDDAREIVLSGEADLKYKDTLEINILSIDKV